MKKVKSRLLILISIFAVIFIIFQMVTKDHENTNTKQAKIKEENINSKLPFTLQVEESDQKPETIAYRIWFDFIKGLESDGLIANPTFTRFTKLSGDGKFFVVAVVFQVQLPEGTPRVDYGWGKMQDNRFVPNIVWKLTINKGENTTYTLTNIERTTNTQIGLPPVETMEEYRRSAGIKEPSKNIKYEIKDETLRVTYDNGKNWRVVPVGMGDLFSGGSNGSEQQLMDGSYVITREITAFALNEGARVLVSADKGESWNKALISDQLPFLRLLKLGFTSNRDGYLIVTGDKTMSWEAHSIFKTNDGGLSWYNIKAVDDTHQLVTDGGFINDQLGFISYGEYRYEGQPPCPNLYRTTDGGVNWERVVVPIPDEYQGYFTIAEIPTFHGTIGTLLVNQGPVGDYLGGRVLAKFTTNDQGKSWSFAGLVDPDGVLRAKSN